jgi:hypothetical protein
MWAVRKQPRRSEVCVCVFARARARLCVCACARARARLRACLFVCVCARVRVRVRACVPVCVRLCVPNCRPPEPRESSRDTLPRQQAGAWSVVSPAVGYDVPAAELVAAR